jgi:hypothetical protein
MAKKTVKRRVAARPSRGDFNQYEVAKRLREIAGDYTLRELGKETGANHETIRRYLEDGKPSVEFVHSFCRRFKVSADWLLGISKGKSRG